MNLYFVEVSSTVLHYKIFFHNHDFIFFLSFFHDLAGVGMHKPTHLATAYSTTVCFKFSFAYTFYHYI